MTDCQNYVATIDNIATIKRDAGNLAGVGDALLIRVFDFFTIQPINFLTKPNLATQSDNFSAHGLNHLDQLKGTNVGFADIHNLFWRACLHKFGEHLTPQKSLIFNLTVKFAVRKGACAPFAKLYV